MQAQVATKNAITLKGSAQMIKEFFHYGINSILYQRGIYPPDSFNREKKYGMTLLISTDERLQKFLKPLLSHVEALLCEKKLKRLIVVISDITTKDVMERWQFDIEPTEASLGGDATTDKDEKRIKHEISDILRQITASVAFLPLLEASCAFDVLIHTFKDADLPEGWADSSECKIENAEQVQLRFFSTGLHKVNTQVQYRADL